MFNLPSTRPVPPLSIASKSVIFTVPCSWIPTGSLVQILQLLLKTVCESNSNVATAPCLKSSSPKESIAERVERIIEPET